MKTRTTPKRIAAAAFSFSLIVAACGSSDSDSDDGGDTTADDEATADDAAEATADDAADDSGDNAADDDAMEEDDAADDAADDDAMEEDAMGEATGEPFVVGVQNLEGDPNGSFPEFSLAMEAAADYVNAELGGLQGRPIELEICRSVVSPDDSQRCANELSASGVDLAISTVNFFGNHFSIYQGSDIPVLVVTPITLADFTAEGTFAIGAGGGCLGVHTGMVEFATNQIEDLEGIDVQSVAVPWADTPPGVVCYNDLEAKPLDVINGTTPGDAARAGEKPDLSYVGIPIVPATPDVTPQATEVLDSDPDVIIYSAQGADCWNFVDALGRLGWTPDQTPLVLSGACIDFDAMSAAGDLANGVYFAPSPNDLLSPLDSLEPGKNLDDATVYQLKSAEYGLPDSEIFKGFATQGFSAIMNIWDASQGLDEVTGDALGDAFAATDGSAETFGGAPLNCQAAPAPYVAVCASDIGIKQWDGTQLVPVIELLTGLDLVAGTELRPG